MASTEVLSAALYGVVSAAVVTAAYIWFKLQLRRSRAARLQVQPVRYMRLRLER